MQTRLLTPDDAALYLEFRRQALLTEPLAFLSSPQDDVTSSIAEVRRQLGRGPDSVMFGAFDGTLVGAVGVYRDPKLKAAHKHHMVLELDRDLSDVTGTWQENRDPGDPDAGLDVQTRAC